MYLSCQESHKDLFWALRSFSYIYDVSSIQLSKGAKINLYADDMLLFKQIKTHEDFCHLQSDIIKVKTWVEQNHLTLNTTKCIFMLVTKKDNTAAAMHP